MTPLDREGRSDLHYAARDGDLTAVRQFVEAGEDVNLPDRRGWTPLHFAAQALSPEVVEYLLAHGAVVDAQDLHGNIAGSEVETETQPASEMPNISPSSKRQPAEFIPSKRPILGKLSKRFFCWRPTIERI